MWWKLRHYLVTGGYVAIPLLAQLVVPNSVLLFVGPVRVGLVCSTDGGEESRVVLVLEELR